MKQEGERGCGEKERAAQFSAVQCSAVSAAQSVRFGNAGPRERTGLRRAGRPRKAHFRIAARTALVLFCSSVSQMGLVLVTLVGLARPTSLCDFWKCAASSSQLNSIPALPTRARPTLKQPAHICVRQKHRIQSPFFDQLLSPRSGPCATACVPLADTHPHCRGALNRQDAEQEICLQAKGRCPPPTSWGRELPATFACSPAIQHTGTAGIVLTINPRPDPWPQCPPRCQPSGVGKWHTKR